MRSVFIALLFSFSGTAFASESATYRVTITSNWNVQDHLDLPGRAHFSPVVAVSHSRDYALLPMGGLATPGLEDVAELGQTDAINAEIDDAIDRDVVGDLVITENQFVRDQVMQEFEVIVTSDKPFLSFVSMIAPSPDWVIGIDSLSLYRPSMGFISEVISMPLYAINAGTEDGDRGGNFSLRNSETRPQEPISRLFGSGFDVKFATVEIELVN